MTEIRHFIANYRMADEPRIRFAWNGEHGEGFGDSNYSFRKEVLEAVLAEPDAASVRLIRDLYRAETEFSREAWCIDRRVGQLAEALLRRGGEEYIEDYLIGKMQSFDAFLASASFEIDHDLAQSLLDAVEKRLDEQHDEGVRKLLQFGRETFERWVEGTIPQG